MILLIIIHWQNFGDKLAKLDLDYKLILDILFYSISTCGYNETEKVGFHLYIQMSLTLKNKIKYIQNLKNLNLMDLQENF